MTLATLLWRAVSRRTPLELSSQLAACKHQPLPWGLVRRISAFLYAGFGILVLIRASSFNHSLGALENENLASGDSLKSDLDETVLTPRILLMWKELQDLLSSSTNSANLNRDCNRLLYWEICLSTVPGILINTFFWQNGLVCGSFVVFDYH